MIEWFCKNHVAANLLLVTIVIAGLFSLFTRIPLEIFPTFESNVVEVRISLRGATPEDAELSVATRVEEAVQDLEGIEEISSRSTEGGSSIFIEVESSYDPRVLLDEVKNRVDAINTLPSDAERPIISLAIRKRDVMMVTVSGDVSEREIREQVEQIRNELLLLPNVSQVELNGVRDFEIAVEISQDRLRQYNLSLNQVSQAIQQSSLDLSAGNIRTDGGDILIRAKGQAYTKDQFEAVVLKTHKDGTILTLKDIATVSDGFEETAIRTRFNGQLAAGIRVFRIGKQSAIQVAKEVREYIEAKQPGMPQGMTISYWDDDSQIVKSRIKTLTTNALQGGVLVLLLLSLFLRPAVAFWVFIGIPVSFLGAFLVMPFLGVTLNLISLFAFIVVLGIVVDDAIVTGENIYTHLGTSESGLSAAINGTKEVAVPVTFGILTTVAAFVPLFFMGGMRGPIFAQIPAIVIPVLLFSLIESKLVLPAHLKYLKVNKDHKPNRLERIQQNVANGFENAIIRYYTPVLKLCTENRATTLLLFIGTLFCIGLAAYLGHSKFTFMPRIPSETVRVNLTLPTGTPFEVTDKHTRVITEHARALKQKYTDEDGQSIILNILSTTGGRGGASHQGEVRFEISPPESRESTITSRELSKEWRQLIGEIPGAESLTFRAEIGRGGDPVDVQLRSNNFAELELVSNRIKERLSTYPTVFDINDSLADGKEELRIELKPEAYLLGVTRAEVIRQVRQAFFGIEAQRVQRGRDDVRVMVRFPREERESLAHLNNMLIVTPTGEQVPFTHIAAYTPSQSPTAIYRIDGYRTVNVRADVDKDATNMTVLQNDLNSFVSNLVAQYPGMSYKMGGESEEQRESFTSLYWGVGAVILVIYALLAIPFGSYSQPLIVMSIIPYGLIGAMLGHWLMGMDLTIMSLLGILALIGIIVNDSLVLVDYINKMRSTGMSVIDAVLTAGNARFRPVMLTSLTTFIGLMPLLFEKATQAQFLIPMAVSLGFGIIFATLITLILVPVNYLLMESAKRYFGWIKTSLTSYATKLSIEK